MTRLEKVEALKQQPAGTVRDAKIKMFSNMTDEQYDARMAAVSAAAPIIASRMADQLMG